MEAYLDNSATTKCAAEVVETAVKVMSEDYGNPSSKHMKGVDAEKYIREAKEVIAKTLKCQDKEILFTSGGTESNNMAIIGTAMANKRKGMHCIVSSVEHSSVKEPFNFLEKEGFQSSVARRMGISFLSGLIHMLCFQRVKDVTSGFRAVNKKFIKLYAENYPSDYPEPEAIVAAIMHRGKIIEVPVVMKERAGGSSSINLRRSIYYMIKVTLAIFVSRISFGIRRGKKNDTR